jgi:hypothetical protein
MRQRDTTSAKHCTDTTRIPRLWPLCKCGRVQDYILHGTFGRYHVTWGVLWKNFTIARVFDFMIYQVSVEGALCDSPVELHHVRSMPKG